MPVIPEDYRKVAFKSQNLLESCNYFGGIGPILSREKNFANVQCNFGLLSCFARHEDYKAKSCTRLVNMSLLIYFV